MTCADCRAQLTVYLDGDLEDDHGSAVRGHLRGCAECSQVARDEAALRDGLRTLPPVDPPPSLWAGVQQRLAAAEVADAERPAWRRALARWAPKAPRYGIAGLAAAAAITVLVVKYQRSHEAAPAVARIAPAAAPVPAPAPAPAPTADLDVAEDLAQDADRETAAYAQSAADALAEAKQAREQWSLEHEQTFDTRVADLQKQVASAQDARARQRVYRTMIRYLQRAANRDEVALAEAGTP